VGKIKVFFLNINFVCTYKMITQSEEDEEYYTV